MVIVHKYGGSSVASTEQIEKIANHIKELWLEDTKVVVVASAMGKTTNNLISLSGEITSSPNKRELDALLSTGETQTVSLLSIALTKLGVNSVSLTGFQAGIKTDNNFNHAFIQSIEVEKIQRYLDENKVVVVAGFQGINENGDITTLGRGGSDTTAVAIASALHSECEIYTDVDCIYTINPAIYPNAKELHQITFDEVMEMAVGGAKVLEARSVELAKKNNIKLYLGKTLVKDKTRGTYLVNNTFEDMPITNLSFKDSVSILSVTINSKDNHQSIVAKTFDLLKDQNLNLEMVSQISVNGTTFLSFAVPEPQTDEIVDLLNKNLSQDDISLHIKRGLCKAILVGVGFLTHKELVHSIFETLGENGIAFSHISMSEISVTFTISPTQKEKTLNTLAQKFGL